MLWICKGQDFRFKREQLCTFAKRRVTVEIADPRCVKGAISDLQDRVASLERKLTTLGRLAG